MALTLACIIDAPIETVIGQFGASFGTDDDGYPIITIGDTKSRMIAGYDNKEETKFACLIDKFAIGESKARALVGILHYCHVFPWRVRVLFNGEIQVLESVHRDGAIQVTMTSFWKTATVEPSERTTP